MRVAFDPDRQTPEEADEAKKGAEDDGVWHSEDPEDPEDPEDFPLQLPFSDAVRRELGGDF